MAAYEPSGPLHTDRLDLRPYREEDFAALLAMRTDPEVARYTYWEPQTEDEVHEALAARIVRVALREEGDVLAFAATLRSTGEMVADVYLQWLSAEHGSGELGYSVLTAHAGNGYATEATRPLLGVAFDEVGLHRVIGRIEPRNGGSARVLEKLGMRLEAHLVENEWVKGEWQSEGIYAILDREWRAAQAAT